MYNISENITTITVALITLGILGWGYYRARPYGTAGILAWLQSVVLMAPWLLFLALFAAGIYLNLVFVLFLLVACTGLYIYLGRQLRTIAAKDIENQPGLKTIGDSSQLSSNEEETQPTQDKIANTEPQKEQTSEFIPIPSEDLQKIKDILVSILSSPPKLFLIKKELFSKAIYGEM